GVPRVGKFPAEAIRMPREPRVNLNSGEHAEHRRGQVNPPTGPDMADERGAERARWVHAHAGDRGFKRDVSGNQQAGETAGVRSKLREFVDREDDKDEGE